MPWFYNAGVHRPDDELDWEIIGSAPSPEQAWKLAESAARERGSGWEPYVVDALTRPVPKPGEGD